MDIASIIGLAVGAVVVVFGIVFDGSAVNFENLKTISENEGKQFVLTKEEPQTDTVTYASIEDEPLTEINLTEVEKKLNTSVNSFLNDTKWKRGSLWNKSKRFSLSRGAFTRSPLKKYLRTPGSPVAISRSSPCARWQNPSASTASFSL